MHNENMAKRKKTQRELDLCSQSPHVVQKRSSVQHFIKKMVNKHNRKDESLTNNTLLPTNIIEKYSNSVQELQLLQKIQFFFYKKTIPLLHSHINPTLTEDNVNTGHFKESFLKKFKEQYLILLL